MSEISIIRHHDYHGHSKNRTMSPTYISWYGMKARCLNPNHSRYQYYGGRGIKVCDRWLIFKNFLEDMGIRLNGMTLERVNNDGNYEPSNCKWATWSEQMNNQSKRK